MCIPGGQHNLFRQFELWRYHAAANVILNYEYNFYLTIVTLSNVVLRHESLGSIEVSQGILLSLAVLLTFFTPCVASASNIVITVVSASNYVLYCLLHTKLQNDNNITDHNDKVCLHIYCGQKYGSHFYNVLRSYDTPTFQPKLW